MSARYDRDTRAYRNRLLLCGLLLLCLAILASVCLARREAAVQLSHDRALISALLSRGVPETTLAEALKSPKETAAGAAFLDRIGWGPDVALRDVPEGRAFLFYALACLLAAIVPPVLLTAIGTRRYLRRREALYEEASDTLLRYLDGDSDARLPHGESGGVYTLLSGADALIMTLQSRSEAERHTKDALRDAVSDISHQLKTPLAALRLYHDLTVGAADDPVAVRDFAAKSAVSIDRIERLIQTLLKVMRLDAGCVQFHQEPCRIDDLVHKATTELQTRASCEGKALTLSGDPEATLICDPQWTVEALTNLIKNALDYTRAGGHVAVGWARSPGMLRITIADDGIGISDDDLPFLFKRFYRSAGARDIQGVGLGLPLTKAVVEGQGGQIGVKSAAGRGSVFTLSFLTES